MSAVTIRKLSPETHRALKLRARRHGRSTEAEIRAILDAAVKPAGEIGIGSALAALGRRFRGVDLEIERDPAPARPMRFE
jgi:plasmid stability protein